MTTAILDPATTDPTADPTTVLSTRDLETQLLGLAGNLAAAQCRFLQLLAEFDRRGGWAGPGLKSCAHWLCWRIGMNLRTATEHVRIAHALTHLPKITEAFAAGRISYSKVRAITRIAGRPAPDPGPSERDPDIGDPDNGDPSCDTRDLHLSGGASGSADGNVDGSVDGVGFADRQAAPNGPPRPGEPETHRLAHDADQQPRTGIPELADGSARRRTAR